MGDSEMRRNAFQHKAPSASAAGPQRTSLKEVLAAYGALFASLATLFCCALPAFLVLLGFGLTTVQVVFTSIPGWQGFGQYDMWLMPLSGALVAVGFYFAYYRQRARQGKVCEIPEGGRESACSTATRWNRRILWAALVLYVLSSAMNAWGIEWMKAHGYFNH